jgi:hypothetical protein
MGPRFSLDAVEKRNILPCREWNPGLLARTPSRNSSIQNLKIEFLAHRLHCISIMTMSRLIVFGLRSLFWESYKTGKWALWVECIISLILRKVLPIQATELWKKSVSCYRSFQIRYGVKNLWHNICYLNWVTWKINTVREILEKKVCMFLPSFKIGYFFSRRRGI